MIDNIQILLENQGFSNGSFESTPREFLISLNRTARREQLRVQKKLHFRHRAILKYKQAKQQSEQHWESVYRFLRNLTPLRQLILNEYMKFARAFTTITVSIPTIAKRLGCCERSVNRLLEELSNFGLLQKKLRWNKSALRHLHPVLHDPRIAVRLWRVFDVYRDYYQKASPKLLCWLIFQKEVALSLRYFNPSICSKSDIQLYEYTHIREVEVPMIPITEFLRNDVTRTLHLTKKGQLYLSAFSDEALKHAIEGLRHLGNNSQKDNFKLFLNLCYSYSHEHKLIVQTERADDLIREYGCKEFGPYYRESSVIPIVRPAPQPTPKVEYSKIEAATKPRRMIAVNPLFNDVFAAMAINRGDEDRLDFDAINANFNEDA